MEEVVSSDGFSIFIDYAHTPDALQNVLETLVEMKGK
jgi:UDP-N-acetylmuramyl tripeptide synthase